MNSLNFPTPEVVMTDLGAGFINAVLDSVEGACSDYSAFKEWKPEWFPFFTSRFMANFLHERIWARLVQAVEGLDGFSVHDQEPVRELLRGTQYIMRIKRHHPDDKISSFPTPGSLSFWTNGANTFEGLETVKLAIGYYWDSELREVGDAVLSYRDTMDEARWAVRLEREVGSATAFTYHPVDPEMPQLDLSQILSESEEEASS